MSTENNNPEKPEENQGFLDGKLGNYEEPWSKQTWVEVDKILHPKRKRFLFWWVFSCLLGLTGGTGLYLSLHENQVQANLALNPVKGGSGALSNKTVEFENLAEGTKPFEESKKEPKNNTSHISTEEITEVGIIQNGSPHNGKMDKTKNQRNSQAIRVPGEKTDKNSYLISDFINQKIRKENNQENTDVVSREKNKEAKDPFHPNERETGTEGKIDPIFKGTDLTNNSVKKEDKESGTNHAVPKLPGTKSEMKNENGFLKETDNSSGIAATETSNDAAEKVEEKEKIDSVLAQNQAPTLLLAESLDSSEKNKPLMDKRWFFSLGAGYGPAFQQVKSATGLSFYDKGYRITASNLKQSFTTKISATVSKAVSTQFKILLMAEIHYWKQEIELREQAGPDVPVFYSYNEENRKLDIRPEDSKYKSSYSRELVFPIVSLGLEYQIKSKFGIRLKSGVLYAGIPISNHDKGSSGFTLVQSAGIFKRWSHQIETEIEYSSFGLQKSALPVFEGSSSSVQLLQFTVRYCWP